MNARLIVDMGIPVGLGLSTALGLLAAGLGPIESALTGGAAAMWLVLVLWVPERGDA